MSTEMMTTPPEEAKAKRSPPTWLLVLVVGLLAAAIGFGAGYLVYEAEPAAEVDAQVQALLDEFWAAAEVGDVDALVELSPSGQFFGYPLDSTSDIVLRTRFGEWAEIEGPKPVGEPMVVGEFGSYDVAQRGTIGGIEYLFYFRMIDYFTDGLVIDYVDTGTQA